MKKVIAIPDKKANGPSTLGQFSKYTVNAGQLFEASINKKSVEEISELSLDVIKAALSVLDTALLGRILGSIYLVDSEGKWRASYGDGELYLTSSFQEDEAHVPEQGEEKGFVNLVFTKNLKPPPGAIFLKDGEVQILHISNRDCDEFRKNWEADTQNPLKGEKNPENWRSITYIKFGSYHGQDLIAMLIGPTFELTENKLEHIKNVTKNMQIAFSHIKSVEQQEVALKKQHEAELIARDAEIKKIETLLQLKNAELDEYEEHERTRRMLSHDINQPLASVLVAVQQAAKFIRMEEQYFENPGQDSLSKLRRRLDNTPEMLDNSEISIKKIVEMLEEHLRNLNRKEKVELSAINPNTALVQIKNGAYLSFRDQLISRNVTLLLDTDPDLPTVLGHSVGFDRLLTNLISNSTKFTPEGGRIIVSAKKSEDGESIEFSVQDDGIGMCQEKLDELNNISVFLKGSTKGVSGEEGHGFGVSSAHYMAKGMGTSVRWFSEGLDKGTKVVFSLRVFKD